MPPNKLELPFDLIVIDLETNAESPPTVRITEIGAVRVTKDLKIADSFSQLVNAMADGIPLSPRSIEITSITEEMLSGQPSFEIAAELFEKWCKKSDDFMLAAHGTHFDISVLRHEYNRIHVDYPFRGACIDTKSCAMSHFWSKGTRCAHGSVKKILTMLGLEFEGTAHRASVDAMNTARYYVEVLKRMAIGRPK